MNLYPATAYIRHLFSARSAAGYGVHSPFVFDFLTNVVRGKSDRHVIREVESLRQEMLADRRTVGITDLGAGSVTRKGEERRISEIARTALFASQAGRVAGKGGQELRAQSSGLRVQGSGLTGAERRSPAPSGGHRAQGSRSRATQSRSVTQLRKEQSDAVRHQRERSGLTGGERRSPAPAEGSERHPTFIILELGTSLGISTLACRWLHPRDGWLQLRDARNLQVLPGKTSSGTAPETQR